MNFRLNNIKNRLSAMLAFSLFLCLIQSIFLFTDVVYAQAWKAGRASLMKNDVKTAQAQLTAALKASKSKTELAETYKYLGVAQYMAGNKPAATASFKQAKANNPSVKLTDSEVVDESVIPVFQSAVAGGRASPAAKTTASSSPKGSAGAAPGIVKKQSKRTIIKVVSNVPTARVSLEGIAYGTAGQEIEIDPGVKVLEVDSAGYKTKAIKVKVDPLTISTVTVNLEKIPPKPKPIAAPKNIPLPSAKSPAGLAKSTAKKAGGDELFGAEPEIQFTPPPVASSGRGASQATPSIPQQVIPPPAPVQPMMPAQGYGLAQPMYQPQPMYAPQPIYQPQPMYAPQPMYGYQPNPYMQPGYPAPNPYGGYAPPPNPYAYSPPPAAPSPYQPYTPPPVAASDPYGGYLGPPPEAAGSAPPPAVDLPPQSSGSGGGMPPPPILPSASGGSGPTASKKEKEEQCGTFIKILPFGAGQFCHGGTFKGLFFLGAEAGALYFYKSNTDQAAVIQAKLNSVLAERAAAREELSGDEQIAFDEETASKEEAGKKSIAQANQNAQYSMISFVGLWGLGIADAFINVPSDKPSKSKKKGKKSRIIQSYHLDLDKAPMGSYALAMPLDLGQTSELIYGEYSIGYTPTINQETNQLEHSLTLGMSWEL